MTQPRFTNSDEVFDYLMGFVNVEKGQKTEFKLDRMRNLCAQLGRPESAYRAIHVAGSKGKGSVSAMTASILGASGLRTGLYTSPHLLRWKERMSLAEGEMPEELILEAMASLLPLVEGKGHEAFVGGELPTYFELTTLVAFQAFRLAGCEAAVIETGLGGRLDSTNVVDSVASVIMPIELEHTEWLGDTIAKIAYEKAGIIKSGKTCVVSSQRPEAFEVFAATCAERGSPLWDVRKKARIHESTVDRGGTEALLSFDLPGPLAVPRRYRSPLVGSVQAENMAIAILAASILEPELEAETVARGLARARLPARFEILDLEPPVILDGAHTPASIRLCLESFTRLFPGPADLVFACAQDKKHEEMAAILKASFASITITRPGTFKQSKPDEVARSFGLEAGACALIPDTEEALLEARKAAKASGRPLLVAGSFYLCSEAARLFGPGRG